MPGAVLGLEGTYVGYTERRPDPSFLVGMDSKDPLNKSAIKVRKQGLTRLSAEAKLLWGWLGP